jgi:long-subunit fatty acid transport protein
LGITHNCDCLIPGLTVGFAIFAPNAYPTRSIGDSVVLDDASKPPPPSRYDIVAQKATAINPTIAASYRILSTLDVGARFTWGITQVDSRRFTWVGENYSEWIGSDSNVVLKAKDTFVPGWSVGTTFRPTPAIELAAQYTAAMESHAVGTATITPSKDARLSGQPVFFTPSTEPDPTCAPGGSATALNACVDFMLPMFASVGGRYKILDGAGKMRGDVEVNVQWENWSAASNSKATVKGLINGEIDIKEAVIRHGFRDTYSIRAGGSYVRPVSGHDLTLRGGAAYDTGAAKAGWERLDFDGAKRMMLTAGASYRMPRYQIDVGGGVALQGTRDVGGNCNPTKTAVGCNGTGVDTPVADRAGWDPGQAAFPLDSQVENPVNHGQYKSHYVMFMLGVSTWF